jgi:hypothetical protein
MSKKTFAFIVLIITLLFIFVADSHPRDRCQEYVQDVRKASIKHLGLGFPYWYNIGCMKAESSCRGDITSFDGGIGPYQFTPSTGVVSDLARYGIIVDPYSIESSINGQAAYINVIMTKKFKIENSKVNKHPIKPASYVRSCGMNLSDVYKYYNAGFWFFYDASRKQGTSFVCENRESFKYCTRGGTWVGSGKNKRWLSFCEVNYSYPEKIYDFSKPYKIGEDGNRFWYEKTPEPIKEIKTPLIIKEEKPKNIEGFDLWGFLKREFTL